MCAVASLTLVSPGTVTEGVTLFFPEKSDDLLVIIPKTDAFLKSSPLTLSPSSKWSFVQCSL